ncbi:hypothetical protein CVT25_001274 [Psilocybe cyanescens]|uniref:Endonuclease/exonuclease/phosphatase domain-containing protein n=1 Tax=Psilocybe cyanescens TaxID=93625 RepID=A0A409XEN7_PSICY|nr:hypothetical protein CVT25_001274 [Psilocybe cyanescens]
MLPDRLYRALSAFNHSTQRWAAIPLHGPLAQRPSLPPRDVDKQRLSLVSWNVDAFHSRPAARSKLILKHILEGPKPPGIKSGLAFGTLSSATDAEDNTSFDDVPFATMTLLSNKCFASDSDPQEGGDGVEGGRKLMPESVFRMPLASKYGRDVLCVDIAAPAPAAPGTVLRLLNVHLDSLDSLLWRTQQMEILAGVLREPGCGGGLIAGDFNAITPEDDGLVDKNELVDAWVALHGRTGPNGVTWGVGVELKNGLKPGRLDKVAMLGLKAEEMEVLQLGLIHVPRPAGPPLDSPWSDHCGLRCTFTI